MIICADTFSDLYLYILAALICYLSIATLYLSFGVQFITVIVTLNQRYTFTTNCYVTSCMDETLALRIMLKLVDLRDFYNSQDF